MKFKFQTDTGKVYKTSPDIEMTEHIIYEIYEFAANEWEEVPEVDCDDNEMTFWFDTALVNESNFQKYIDDINKIIGLELPKYSEWK